MVTGQGHKTVIVKKTSRQTVVAQVQGRKTIMAQGQGRINRYGTMTRADKRLLHKDKDCQMVMVHG